MASTRTKTKGQVNKSLWICAGISFGQVGIGRTDVKRSKLSFSLELRTISPGSLRVIPKMCSSIQHSRSFLIVTLTRGRMIGSLSDQSNLTELAIIASNNQTPLVTNSSEYEYGSVVI